MFYLNKRVVIPPHYEFRLYSRQLSASDEAEQFWAIVPNSLFFLRAVLIDDTMKKLAIIKGELPENIRKEDLPVFWTTTKKLPLWVRKALKAFQRNKNILQFLRPLDQPRPRGCFYTKAKSRRKYLRLAFLAQRHHPMIYQVWDDKHSQYSLWPYCRWYPFFFLLSIKKKESGNIYHL